VRTRAAHSASLGKSAPTGSVPNRSPPPPDGAAEVGTRGETVVVIGEAVVVVGGTLVVVAGTVVVVGGLTALFVASGIAVVVGTAARPVPEHDTRAVATTRHMTRQHVVRCPVVTLAPYARGAVRPTVVGVRQPKLMKSGVSQMRWFR
jgi:hypothetical protein